MLDSHHTFTYPPILNVNLAGIVGWTSGLSSLIVYKLRQQGALFVLSA
jgi:hypothetical protein